MGRAETHLHRIDRRLDGAEAENRAELTHAGVGEPNSLGLSLFSECLQRLPGCLGRKGTSITTGPFARQLFQLSIMN